MDEATALSLEAVQCNVPIGQENPLLPFIAGTSFFSIDSWYL